MFYSRMWGSCGAFGRPLGHEVMWSAYLNGLLSVDLENMPEDADADPHVGMRPSLSTPPLDAPSPAKGALPPPHALTNGSSPAAHLNGTAGHRGSDEEQKIEEYRQRSDTAVIYPEPVGGVALPPKESKEGGWQATPVSREPSPVIEEPKVLSEYLLKCPHCEQVFSGQQAIHELKEHLDHSHKEVPPPDPPSFVCQKCNATFSCKENLAKHKLFHLSNGQGSAVNTDDDVVLRKFKCSECGKAFKYKHHLKEHIRIHSGEKPFTCPNCGKRFSHSGSYSSHMTSKKCLVVNLKVRKTEGRGPRGGRAPAGPSFRPIVPKGGESELPFRPPFPLPLSFHPLLAPPRYLPLGAFPEVTQLLQRRFENECSSGQEPPPPSQPMPPLVPAPAHFMETMDDSPISSPQPVGEMKAVKKILEIVDATVSKQQQSPTRPRNGLLSELLSSSPNPIVKSPPPPSIGHTSMLDTRCRYCSRLFDNKIDLYQHERYVCPHNFDPRTAKPGTSERSLYLQENGSDGNSAGEDRPPSLLSMESVASLKAHYQTNPRPRKSEMIRLARDLKCTTRTVQDWFHNQQIRSKDYPMTNGTDLSFGAPVASHSYNNGSSSLVAYRPIAERSPLLEPSRDSYHHAFEDQPLDLSLKVKPADDDEVDVEARSPGFQEAEADEALNLSQRSSRHSTNGSPPKVSSPYSNSHNHFAQESSSPQQSSLLYKYMQLGNSGGSSPSVREKLSAPDLPPLEHPSSPDRSPSRAEHLQSLPSPGSTGYADHSCSPSCTTGSYSHMEETTNGNPYSPSPSKKRKIWNQGDGEEECACEETEEDCSRGRKSWKLHKVESEDGMYACDQCDKMFSKQSSLARHKYEHSGQRPHKCEICNKAFKHKHHLTEHKRLHSGEKPFQCKKCLKRFSHSGSYSQHMNHRYSYCKPYHE